MKKVAIYVSDFYKKNRLFDINDIVSNRDNCLNHWYILREKLRESGYDLATHDINKIEDSEFVIYSDMPELSGINTSKRNILIIFESELIRPDNWNSANHKYFERIFTWNDDWVDGKKYIKYYWPNKIPSNVDFGNSDKNKLCTVISGNKKITHSKELYSERLNAIRWFEQNHSNEFDLYGIGWDRYCFQGKFLKKFNRINYLTKLLAEKHPSYKGKVDKKNEILKCYKFAICYENAKGIAGYITEKIFDCFFAGCVPIYWGAPNVSDYIPKDTFIDREQFNTYDELYNYLSSMTNKEYFDFLASINNYVKGEQIKLFSDENFANIIIKEIIEGK